MLYLGGVQFDRNTMFNLNGIFRYQFMDGDRVIQRSE